MQIKRIIVGDFEVNCFVLSGTNQEAIVIDPGAEPEKIIKFVKDSKLTVKHCFATHGHIDHISALSQVVDDLTISNIYMHKDDASWAFSEENSIMPYYPPPAKLSVPISYVQHGDSLVIAGIKINVIHTPGHTLGGISLYLPEEKKVFTGDTLFNNGVGRTDLPGGDARVLGQSLKKLAKLPHDTLVLPGHGEDTTIEAELGDLS